MIERILEARCPAKVNLGLKVLSLREDGYHEIRTVFQAVDLWDCLHARRAPDLTLTCDDPDLQTDESNLVMRAARLLRESFPGVSGGARLHLEKSIPVGGGLGGGSSNAAAALLLLERLWALGQSYQVLETLAARLGADVPFFLHGGTALGAGRGDRITPIPFVGKKPVLLGIPPFQLSTSDVYARFANRLTVPPNSVNLWRLSGLKLPEGNDFGAGTNDLEPVVFAMRPELGSFREALRGEGATLALLSGSGSSVFGVFEDSEERDRVGERLRARFERWKLLSTRTVAAAAHVVESGNRGGA